VGEGDSDDVAGMRPARRKLSILPGEGGSDDVDGSAYMYDLVDY
jgi:hypothetical protein